MTGNLSRFMDGRKSFVNLENQTVETENDRTIGLHNRYRSPEFAMPDWFRSTHEQEHKETLVNSIDQAKCHRKQSALLSKHKGWITVDAQNLRRYEAPECHDIYNTK